MKNRALLVGVAALALVAAAAQHTQARGNPNRTTTVVYDSFTGSASDAYSIDDYFAKWQNGFGQGEMAVDDTRAFDNDTFHVAAAQFQTAYDFGVFDHIKYLATSTQGFAVPAQGSVTFSAEISALTPGTEPGRVIHGCYGPSGQLHVARGPMRGALHRHVARGSASRRDAAHDRFRHGAAVRLVRLRLHRVHPHRALARSRRRLPGRRTHATPCTRRSSKSSRSVPVRTPSRSPTPRELDQSYVEYFLDGKRVSKVGKVGVPLDVQNRQYTGIYPSIGPGEELKDDINTVFIGHGLFSLLDAFPFQHPDAPELSVSIPPSERIFGQGAIADFDDFVVTTVTKS